MKAVLFMMLIPVYCYCNSDASISSILVDQSTVELVLKSEPGKTFTLMTSPDLDVWEESDVFVTDSSNETIALARTTEPAEFYAFSESPTSALIQGTLTELIKLKKDDFTEGGVYNNRIESNATIKILAFNPADQCVYFMVYGWGPYDSNNNARLYVTEYYKLGANGVPTLVGDQESLGNANFPPSPTFDNQVKHYKSFFIGEKLYYLSGNGSTGILNCLDFPNNATHSSISGPFLFNGNEYVPKGYNYKILTNGQKIALSVENEIDTLDPDRHYFAFFDSNLSLLNIWSYPYYDEYGQEFYVRDWNPNTHELVGDYLYEIGNLGYNYAEYTASESGCAIRRLNINDGSYETFIILDNPNDAELGMQLFKFNNNLLVYGYQATKKSEDGRHSFFIKTDLDCVPLWTKYKDYEYHQQHSYSLFATKQDSLTLLNSSNSRSIHFLHVGESGDLSIQATGLRSSYFPSTGGDIFGTDNDYSEPTIFMIDVAD